MERLEQPDIQKHGFKSPGWKWTMELGPDHLRSDPIGSVMNKLMEFKEVRGHKEDIHLLFAELFSNALDYGVLGLDPSLKGSSDGYDSYFTLRGKALETLAGGWIRIDCRLIPESGEFKLVLRVEDSGPGFDQGKGVCALSENLTFHGRGLHLVGSLCKSLAHNEKGNGVEAVYVWQQNGFKQEC